MASSIFVEVKTVDGPVAGESVVQGFEDQIEVSGWSWGVTQVGAAGSGAGGTSGSANVGDLILTVPLDKSYPVLMQAAGVGTHLDTCVLTVCKSGGDLLKVLTITTTGGILSNVHINGSNTSGSAVHTVSFSLNFSEVDIEYTPQDAKGGGGGSTTGSLNVAGNSKGS